MLQYLKWILFEFFLCGYFEVVALPYFYTQKRVPCDRQIYEFEFALKFLHFWHDLLIFRKVLDKSNPHSSAAWLFDAIPQKLKSGRDGSSGELTTISLSSIL